MLHSAHDYALVRQYPPLSATLEPGAIVHRGLAELRPRRLSLGKLVAAAVRMLASRSAQPLTATSVIMPAQPPESLDTMDLLIDMPLVTLTAPVFPALLSQLHTGTGRRLFVALGDGETARAEAHAQLARALAAQCPQLEQKLSQSLHEALARMQGELVPAGTERKRLVIEERPGKASLLNLAEPTLRLATKRWQTFAARSPSETVRSPIEAVEGWGIAAMVLGDATAGHQAPQARQVTFAALTLRLAAEVVTLDTGRILHDLADAWLTEVGGFGAAAVRRLVISAPWLAVAATLRDGFKTQGSVNPIVGYPDFAHGWQPFLTTFEFLCNPDVPALLVYTGRYPDVHLVALW